MPLTPEERTAFLELIPDLGDDVDPRGVLHFARTHRQALLDELVAVPGVARIRAAALRLLPELVPEQVDREPLLSKAGDALMQPPTDHPMERLSRHPAWIGLGVLELAALRRSWDGDPVGRAVELSARAFEAAGSDEIGEGEVIWAMAEQATEVGWTARARLLLARIPEASFHSPQRRAEAVLVAAIDRLQAGEEARDLLRPLPAELEAPARVRTHAAWILAQLALQASDEAAAGEWLRSAAETVDRDEDPGVAERIDAALAAL